MDRAHPRGPRPGSGESGLAACTRGPERGDRKARHGGGRGVARWAGDGAPSGRGRAPRRAEGSRSQASRSPPPRGPALSPGPCPHPQGSGQPRGGSIPAGWTWKAAQNARPGSARPPRGSRGLLASHLIAQTVSPGHRRTRGRLPRRALRSSRLCGGGIEGTGVRRAEPTGSVVPGNKRQQRRTHRLQFGPF